VDDMERKGAPRYVIDLARDLRSVQTPAEEVLWACLRDRSLAGVKFRRQHPMGRYIADPYCHEAWLVVELEGGIHRRTEQHAYDSVRRETLKAQELRVMTFTNEEVELDPEKALNRICQAVNPLVPPSPTGRGDGSEGIGDNQ